jgi:hypothetical protein
MHNYDRFLYMLNGWALLTCFKIEDLMKVLDSATKLVPTCIPRDTKDDPLLVSKAVCQFGEWCISNNSRPEWVEFKVL